MAENTATTRPAAEARPVRSARRGDDRDRWTALHLPLNNDIDEAGDPVHAADIAAVRDDVEAPWVVGNIPRTLLSTAAVAALGRALLLHGRNTTDPTAAGILHP